MCSHRRVCSISTCLICRFILNLRGIYFTNDTSRTTDLVSTIAFVNPGPVLGTVGTSLVGNMGAPLRTDDEEGLSEDGIHVSNDPFSFGLIPLPQPGDTD